MKDKPISVLIADDHSVVRIGMSALLGAEGDIHVVGQAKNGMEAVAQAIEKLPDVIIMDIEMPKKDGIEATTDILAEIPDARILILTSFSTTDRIARAIKAGALGAIMKNADDTEMVAAVRNVAQGKSYIARDVRRLFKADPPAPELSPRQRQILDSLTRGLTQPRHRQAARHQLGHGEEAHHRATRQDERRQPLRSRRHSAQKAAPQGLTIMRP